MEIAKNICVITIPFGNFWYECAPTGFWNSLAFAQACMEEVFRNIPEVDVYINDIGIFTNSWERHIEVVDKVMRKLEERSFTFNPLKWEWAVKETNWLGYWVTPDGLKPLTKKFDAILKLKPPSNAYEIRHLVGMVNYYRYMWPRRTHMLTPFTALSSGPRKQKVEWITELNFAFKQLKTVLAKDALIAFPNHNLPFEIYTDASDYQMGACIMQEGQPVAHYSKKLNPSQRIYTTR